MVQSTTNYVCLQIHDKLFSIIISPLDVKNCGLFCLHGVFSLKERGGGIYGDCIVPSPDSLLSMYVSTIHQVGGKEGKNSVVSQNRSCLCSLYWSMNDIL